MTFRILTGAPHEVQSGLNNIKGKVKIESVETKFDKYGVERMAIVVSVTDVSITNVTAKGTLFNRETGE